LLLSVIGAPLCLLQSALGELFGHAYSRLPGIGHGNEFIERRTEPESLPVVPMLWYLYAALVATAFK